MVWPDSSSVCTRNDGSSCARRQRHAHLFLVGLGLGLDRQRNHRLREFHALEHDDVVGRAQGVTRGDVLQANRRGDIARTDFLDFLAIVRMHLQQATDALFATLDRIEHGVAGIEHAGINAEEGQRTDERVGGDLERQRGERLGVIGVTLGRGTGGIVQ